MRYVVAFSFRQFWQGRIFRLFASGVTATATAFSFTACDVSTTGATAAADATTSTDSTTSTSSTPDTTAPTFVSIDAPVPSATYGVGKIIPIAVTFSEPVVVTGVPYVILSTGAPQHINYSSGSGTATLLFNYTVHSGDAAGPALDYASTTAFQMNGGTIKDTAGNAVTAFTLPAPGAAGSISATRSIVIDTVAPTTSTVTSSSPDATYKIGDVIPVTVSFSKAVTVTGVPRILMETGPIDHFANYASGSGTSNLTFNYTVQSGDVSGDLDCQSVNALVLNGGAIQDAFGNNANLTMVAPGAAKSLGANKNLVIDAQPPTVVSVHATSGGNKKVGDVVTIRATFSEAVTVTGLPAIKLETGTVDRIIYYSSGSPGTQIDFSYTVQAGDLNPRLDREASSNLIDSTGGSIVDAAGNTADYTLPAPGTANSIWLDNVNVDGVAPVPVSVSSTAVNGVYAKTAHIPITVTFPEPVVVTAGGGPAHLSLTLQTTGTAGNTVAPYLSGSGTSVLTFDYQVADGDTSLDLDYVVSAPLTLGTDTLKDAAGNNAVLTLPNPGSPGSLSSSKDIHVDGVLPVITNVNSTQPTGNYKSGTLIPIQITFSKAITVTGTPTLVLNTTVPKTIDYTSGSPGTVLTFNYTVAGTDTSAKLDFNNPAATALSLSGGTINDSSGNPATLVFPWAANGGVPGAGSLGANKSIVVDTTAPTVSSMSSTTANGTYKNLDPAVDLTVTFSEAVTVTGTPRIALNTTPAAFANYVSGSPGATLVFRYTIGSSDNAAALDYVDTGSLTLNGGTIKDLAQNTASLTLPGIGAGSLISSRTIAIDNAGPMAQSLDVTNTAGTYGPTPTKLTVTVIFDEAVTVSGGTPTLDIASVGLITAIPTYEGGSGTNTLRFTFTPAAGDHTAALDIASPINAHGATFADAKGNLRSPVTLPAGWLPAHKVIGLDYAAPRNLTANQITETSMDLSWDDVAASDGAGYQIQFCAGNAATCDPNLTGFPWVSAGSNLPAKTNRYVLSSLNANSPYDFRIRTLFTGSTSGYAYLGNRSTAPQTLGGNTAQPWLTNGQVYSVVRAGSVTYLGGSFSSVGPNTGAGTILKLDPADFTQYFAFPATNLYGTARPLNGSVYASASDGAGGYYVGGDFLYYVNGVSRSSFMHIDSNGAPYSTFDFGLDGKVTALALGSGPTNGTVFIAGDFTHAGGEARNGLASISLGANPYVSPSFNPSCTFSGGGATVRSLFLDPVASPSKLYAGGSFTGLTGAGCTNPARIARFSTDTGAIDNAWYPNIGGGGESVNAIVWNSKSNNSLVIGGSFSTPRSMLADIPVAGTVTTGFDPVISGGGTEVKTLLFDSNRLYVGGEFTSCGGAGRNNLCAIDFSSGTPVPGTAIGSWSPSINGTYGVSALAKLAPSYIVLGGYFSFVDATPLSSLAVVTEASGSAAVAQVWNPGTNAEVRTLSVGSGSPPNIFAGGIFDYAGQTPRNNLAAIDASTGTVTAWNPNANSSVRALAVDIVNSRIYAGGDFTVVGAVTRTGLAAMDASGAVQTWAPNADDYVTSLTPSGSYLFAGGHFAWVGGQNRNKIAKLDTSGSALAAWSADGSGTPSSITVVNTIALNGANVVVGGNFSAIGNQTRTDLAGLSRDTGLATSWNPNPNGIVNASAVSGTRVYVGGAFTQIGSTPKTQKYVALLDETTSVGAELWTSGTCPSAAVTALATYGTDLYLGGGFTTLKDNDCASNSHVHTGIAVINQLTGHEPVDSGLNPLFVVGNGVSSGISTLSPSGTTLYIGGSFTSVNDGFGTYRFFKGLVLLDPITGQVLP